MFRSICKEAGGGGANVQSDCLCSTFGPLKINKNVKVLGFSMSQNKFGYRLVTI